jgi:hypothetical protein
MYVKARVGPIQANKGYIGVVSRCHYRVHHLPRQAGKTNGATAGLLPVRGWQRPSFLSIV